MTALTVKDVEEYFKSEGYNTPKIEQEYVNVRSKITIEDNFGFKYFIVVCGYKNHKCTKKDYKPHRWHKSNPYSDENMIKWISENSKNYVYVSGNFKNSMEKNIELRCNLCGDFWHTSLDILTSMCGCPYCYGFNSVNYNRSLEKARPDLVLEWDYSKNGDLKPSNVSLSSGKKVWWICKTCGHNWAARVGGRNGNRIDGDYGCPKCGKKLYKGEDTIENFLNINNIVYEKQKRYKDCRNIKPLPFDFYIPSFNLCIEFQGYQHFAPTTCWNVKFPEKEFEEQKKRDNIKREYCKNNSIGLLEIPYWDLRKVDKILEKVFNFNQGEK